MKFKLKDKVEICALEITGLVIAIYISDTGQQFQVRYFYNGEARTVYFYAEELEHVG